MFKPTPSPVNALYPSYGLVDNTLLTHRGEVVGGLRLSGIESTMLCAQHAQRVTELLRTVLSRLEVNLTLTQYFFHHEAEPIAFSEHADPRANLVLQRRARFLNREPHYHSSVFWIVTLPPALSVGKLSLSELVDLSMRSLIDVEARERLKTKLFHWDANIVFDDALQEQIKALHEQIDQLDARLSFLSEDNARLSPLDLWNLHKTLTHLNPDHLQGTQAPPQARWDVAGMSGDVEQVLLENTHTLKINQSEPRYARFASVLRVGEHSVPESAWAQLDAAGHSPVLCKGNYAIVTRFSLLSRQGRRSMLRSKKNALFRDQTKVRDLFKQGANEEVAEQRIEKSARAKKKLAEIEAAEHQEELDGTGHQLIVVMDASPLRLKQTQKHLTRVLDSHHFNVVWETTGSMRAFESMQLGFTGKSIRDMTLSATQAAAMSLPWRTHGGVPLAKVGGQMEESNYVFHTKDGSLFHLNTSDGELDFTIGVGATRSGKSFLRLCLALNLRKYQGYYSAIDIDDGSESLVRFFGDDGGLCKLTKEEMRGFNPFFSCEGEQDRDFATHFTRIVNSMIALNASPERQTWTSDEEVELGEAIIEVMRAPKSRQHFSFFLKHLPNSMRRKLADFDQSGQYGSLFCNEVDGVGSMNKPYSVYNLSAFKDSHPAAPLVYQEVFFRMTRSFENVEGLKQKKILDVDEAQYVFQAGSNARYLEAKARTWAKWGGGMRFWTQSPKHYSDLDNWPVIRSAASTFLFLADPEGSVEEYRQAFDFLTQSQAQRIKTLTPKKELMIVQPKRNICKVVELNVEPEQYVLATSTAHERALVQAVFARESNVDNAIDELVRTIFDKEAQHSA